MKALIKWQKYKACNKNKGKEKPKNPTHMMSVKKS